MVLTNQVNITVSIMVGACVTTRAMKCQGLKVNYCDIEHHPSF